MTVRRRLCLGVAGRLVHRRIGLGTGPVPCGQHAGVRLQRAALPWLVEEFTQHFPEAASTGGDLHYVAAAVEIDIDLERGMQAVADGGVVQNE